MGWAAYFIKRESIASSLLDEHQGSIWRSETVLSQRLHPMARNQIELQEDEDMKNGELSRAPVP